jgi:hypothetical protein
MKRTLAQGIELSVFKEDRGAFWGKTQKTPN